MCGMGAKSTTKPYIDTDRCIGCARCGNGVCPVDAVQRNEDHCPAEDSDEPRKQYEITDDCVECGVCIASLTCPRDAIKLEENK